MIVRHVTYHVNDGDEASFEALFVERYRPAMSRQPGYEGVELLRSASDPQAYRMAIRFDSREHAAGWRESAEHTALKPVIGRLYFAVDIEVFNVAA